MACSLARTPAAPLHSDVGLTSARKGQCPQSQNRTGGVYRSGHIVHRQVGCGGRLAGRSQDTKRSFQFIVRAGQGEGGAAAAAVGTEGTESGSTGGALDALRQAVLKADSSAVKQALDDLKAAGKTPQWFSYPNTMRRTTSVRELTQMGIKGAEKLAVPSTRNDAAFLITVVGTTSVIAVIAGQLPGDWGFFVPYLVGGISLAVLAIGSIAPGLLEAPIKLFAPVFSDYSERVLRHEAGHFLVAYLLGIPVASYTLDIGKEHTNLVDEQLQKRIYEGRLTDGELDRLAAVAMAGMAAEGLEYEEVMGQTADLVSLQRLINRSKPPISAQQQQNLTRWAVLYAASLIKSNSSAFSALKDAMKAKASVDECILAIESAK